VNQPETKQASGASCEGNGAPGVSVVIPVFNEQDTVVPLLRELESVLSSLPLEAEVVVVDDGSKDRTLQLLESEALHMTGLRVIAWSRNRGQAAALLCGLRAARAPLIVTLDGDGQNDPADIPELMAALGTSDMVVGVRAERRDSWLRKAMSRLANRIRSRFLGDGVSDSGCALKVMRATVVDAFVPVRTLYSFIPALAVGAGFSVIERPVRHRARSGGTSSYGLRQFAWWPLIDMLGVRWFLSRRVNVAEQEKPRP